MINNISEGMVRSTTKVDPSHMIHEKETSQQKVAQAKINRPIEGSESGAKTENRETRDKELARFTQVENTMVFEKYDQHGEIILRIPPSTQPVNELA